MLEIFERGKTGENRGFEETFNVYQATWVRTQFNMWWKGLAKESIKC